MPKILTRQSDGFYKVDEIPENLDEVYAGEVLVDHESCWGHVTQEEGCEEKKQNDDAGEGC